MTRDGLIEVNETKETAKRVSRWEREADFSKPKEQPASDMPQTAQEAAATFTNPCFISFFLHYLVPFYGFSANRNSHSLCFA